MKRLKIFSCFFVLQVLLVIPVMAETPVSTGVQTDDREKDGIVEKIITLSRGFSEAGKFDEAFKMLKRAMDKFPQKEDRQKLQIELANVHLWWALNLKKKYHYANAIKHFELAYAIDKNLRLKIAALELSHIGNLYNAIGQNYKALEYYEKALPISQVVGDRAGEAMTLNNIGLVYYAHGQKKKALEYYEKALLICRAVEDRKGEATTLNNIGAVYDALDQKQKALVYYEKALSIHKVLEDRVGEATTLNNIGGVYSTLGQKQKALEYYQEALPIYQAVGNRAVVVTILTSIGQVYSALGQSQKALEYYEKALPIYRAVEDHEGEATTLNNIGDVYDVLGHKQKAIEYYEKALPILKAMGDRAGEATTLNNIGAVYDTLGQKQKALEFYEKVLPIYQSLGDRTREATTLDNIGRVYSDLDQKQKALEYYEKSLTVSQAVGHRLLEVTTLNNIGLVYDALGQKHKALEYYKKALTTWKSVEDRAGEAQALNNIGGVYYDLGQKHKALEFHEKALITRNSVKDRAGEAQSLNNIGGVYSDLGQKHKALEYFKNSLLILQEVGNRTDEAITLNNIGTVYYSLGQNHKALDFYEKGLTISKSVGDHYGQATTLNNIGALYSALGQKHKSLEYYEKALPIWQEGKYKVGEALALSNLMSGWEDLKNKQLSIFYGKQSVNTYQNLRSNISKLDRMIKKNYLEKAKNTYRILTGHLIEEGRIPEAQHVLDMLKEKEYFEFTRKEHSSSTYSQLDFNEFESQWLEKYKKVTKDYSSISGDYYLLKKKKIKSDAEKKQLKELESSIEKYQKDYDEYLTELKKAFDKYDKTVKKGTIKTPNSQNILRERQAILRKLDEKEGGKNVFLNFLVAENGIAVIFTTPNSQFVLFNFISKKKLNRLILEYREAIERRKRAPQKGVNNDSVNKTIYVKLYDHIFKPVDIELKKYGTTNLMIYLDGLLRYIALPVLWDGETYLLQRYRMALFTNASFERIKREPEKNNKILGLGASRGGDGFEPLPNVKEEIQGIVNDKEKGFKGIIPGKAFLDNDFTKETFVNQLKTAAYPLVHISSHFQFNKGDETKSHLLMGDGSLMNLKEIREQKGLFNRVELLMLSACETGRGDAYGREIDGFGELAQQSGAQSVVASLWKVTDESTKDLMVNFYRILKEGKVTSKIEALRKAQLELAGLEDLLNKNKSIVKRKKSKYSHPYFWGPFIMIGNWR